MLKCELCDSEMDGHGYTPITCSECGQEHDRDDDLHMVLDRGQLLILQAHAYAFAKRRPAVAAPVAGEDLEPGDLVYLDPVSNTYRKSDNRHS